MREKNGFRAGGGENKYKKGGNVKYFTKTLKWQ